MTEHSEESRRRAAARQAVGYWYRMGLALAEAKPPQSYSHAYHLGRRMAALRRPMQPPAALLCSAVRAGDRSQEGTSATIFEEVCL
jgi:hypothetical protein